MKKVLLKSGAILNVADDRAAAIMCALEKDVDSYGVYLNGANGSHQGFVRLDAIDAVIDYEITYEKPK